MDGTTVPLVHQIPFLPAEGRPILSPMAPMSSFWRADVSSFQPEGEADPTPHVAERARSILPGTRTISSLGVETLGLPVARVLSDG